MTAIETLLEWARGQTMTSAEREAQRRSFAYGNTRIENPRITRDSINRAAEKLESENGKCNGRPSQTKGHNPG